MIKKLLKRIGIVLAILILLFLIFLIVLTVTEFKPEDRENIDISASEEVSADAFNTQDSYKLISWNIGYCGLSNTADFFMDGGSYVRENTEDQVYDNLSAVSLFLSKENPDFIFLQEVDKNSMRSYGVDETAYLSASFENMDTAFATNYKCLFVPYPLPPIGYIHSGIMTFSSVGITNAERIQLPCPFSWPVRLANLKRCLMVSRVPVEGSDKELVLVNLHLEAYDDGEGKAAQTQMLKEILETETAKGNYVIAAGDFNQAFSNTDTSAYPLIDESYWQAGEIDVSDFDSSWQFLMDSSSPSCRSLDQAYRGADQDNFQYYVIDGFIVSSNVKVEEMKTVNLEFEHSDHNPIELQFTLKE
jgi:endonuclease/exonuclease/phosphatase family metal-dependent hydrolase